MEHLTARLGLGALLALAAAAPVAAQAASDTVPVVVVSGEGLVKVAPDRAWVSAAAEARSAAPREAQAQIAQAMHAVQRALAGAGVPSDAVRTTAVEIHPEFDWANGRQTLRGYLASHSVEVRVDEVARAGEILDLMVRAGATSVQQLRFDVKARETYEREAIRRAVVDARARADAMAAGAGGTIDRVIRIEEPGVRTVPMLAAARAALAVADERAPTPVVAGEIEIRAQVTLTAVLK